MPQFITSPGGAHSRREAGVRVRYAEQGDPTGEASVCLHGYSDSWYLVSRLLPWLSAGYRAFAFDQRGRGDANFPAHGHAMGSSPPMSSPFWTPPASSARPSSASRWAPSAPGASRRSTRGASPGSR